MKSVHLCYFVFFCLTLPAFSGTVQVDSTAVLVTGAIEQIPLTDTYDPSYVVLDYPNGDVPIDRGVCTDVIVRAFRKLNIDLQVLVHTDMKKNFSAYPSKWGLKRPDRNIDHRRVPNLMTWLERHGKSLPVTRNGEEYLPGDIVAWKIPGNLDHIGLVVDKKVEGTNRYGVVHNIGRGTELEDVLFEFRIIGHYRYFR
ncbi:MAG: DUF1287 domain-containing protein [Chitinispirillaceae bacterium]|nr:DUF1287 domain-containing protein [Chitinispirillaceae bacterium]